MTERLLIKALSGGKNTKIITLNGKKMTKMPSALGKLPGLKTLVLQNNLIPKVCPELRTLTQFQDLKLREFYCEGNPLFLKQPVISTQRENVWSLQEITSRFVMNQLAENNPFLMDGIERYPQVRSMISQGKTCAICGQHFITVWLECVRFVSPPKDWKISKNLQLVPLRVLICSYKCFTQRDPNLFGIAQV
ncbi:leucine-rich repeat-containing protein 69 isoform X2 [Macaca nemestrina]|uniref:Leucine rich repeat containing 69 n=4 Tax=Cercopithecinae TaxID=9528 RepID=A0A2K5LDI7_CERAT|nr:leucine-rich repeat-containing protein 69 isoform X2 [Macaca nemestrina]XP_045254421.1 leucine-rich repeat-containing protein 69 isoform X1 [Macaca fascicularis]XP_050658587.1 leucine-rich repeat-containing protein 69 isoform X1 [Macaca thibetana thibetana]